MNNMAISGELDIRPEAVKPTREQIEAALGKRPVVAIDDNLLKLCVYGLNDSGVLNEVQTEFNDQLGEFMSGVFVSGGTGKAWMPVEVAESFFRIGFLSDLYYADIYKEGGEFDNWDSNGNGIFAEWSGEVNDTLDLYPDVAYGRLACTSRKEARDVVNKIINYEKQPADPSWFKKIIVISGDGFLDQKDLNIQWDTKGLPDGKYTIYAQSSNPDGDFGPIDQINITLDKTVETNLPFTYNDHLITGFNYPFPPVAEIVSVSEGNILGNTDYTYTSGGGQAYCNDLYLWANISVSISRISVLKFIRASANLPGQHTSGLRVSAHAAARPCAAAAVFTKSFPTIS